ncbi:hypothetical protein NC651_018141 [Populus alba x Populus x berolinensis]|nr:hypothetical protein NC651_018141 [Populus alba x Populus x berolinensis]
MTLARINWFGSTWCLTLLIFTVLFCMII